MTTMPPPDAAATARREALHAAEFRCYSRLANAPRGTKAQRLGELEANWRAAQRRLVEACEAETAGRERHAD